MTTDLSEPDVWDRTGQNHKSEIRNQAYLEHSTHPRLERVVEQVLYLENRVVLGDDEPEDGYRKKDTDNRQNLQVSTTFVVRGPGHAFGHPEAEQQ